MHRSNQASKCSNSPARRHADSIQDEAQQSFVPFRAGIARHAHARYQLHEVSSIDVVPGNACLLGVF